MAERIFIIDSHQPRLDAAAARRQFSLSVAVGFAVLAVTAIIQFQPTPATPLASPAHQTHSQIVDYALATSSIDRN
jgi:hypothetical protein